MRIAVPREIIPGETRVALVPEAVARLVKSGLEVAVESGAGVQAMFTDEAYRQAGATIVAGARELYAGADVVLKVREPVAGAAPAAHEADLIREGAVLIAFLGRDAQSEAARKLAARGVTAFSMEMIPRISRAQKMDALSSMSTVAGYKAVLLGAASLGKFFPLLMTAAGTIAPARVFVLGAGVAGLQAIATARRLGAVVEAFDVRPAVRDEVQSLGATFVGHELLDEAAVAAGGYAKEMTSEQQAKQRQLVADRLKQSDVVVSTAMVPGRKAPILIPESTVREMRPGSVIVDLAAEMGGNCELTEPGADVVRHGVTILGPVNLAATVPVHASQMYARNISTLLAHLVKDKALHLDFEDEITRDACLVRAGAYAAGAAPAPVVAPMASGGTS
jgi:NAD(P) transhydrogenase subunit alpha